MEHSSSVFILLRQYFLKQTKQVIKVRKLISIIHY